MLTDNPISLTHAKHVTLIFQDQLKRTILQTYRFSKASVFKRSQSQITDFHWAGGASYKNVITFQISVYNWRRSRMQESQAFENLSTPRLQHFRIDFLKSPQVTTYIKKNKVQLLLIVIQKYNIIYFKYKAYF